MRHNLLARMAPVTFTINFLASRNRVNLEFYIDRQFSEWLSSDAIIRVWNSVASSQRALLCRVIRETAHAMMHWEKQMIESKEDDIENSTGDGNHLVLRGYRQQRNSSLTMSSCVD